MAARKSFVIIKHVRGAAEGGETSVSMGREMRGRMDDENKNEEKDEDDGSRTEGVCSFFFKARYVSSR